MTRVQGDLRHGVPWPPLSYPQRVAAMKTLQLEVPDLLELAKEIDSLVEEGGFTNQAELARLALTEFVQRHRFEPEEKFQRDDIRCALGLKDAAR
jgi:hypothetical protein